MRAWAWVVAVSLAGCASGVPAPAWRTESAGALRQAEEAWLRGRTRVADIEFRRAREALAATGRGDLVARAELVRCAVRVASVDFDDCPAYRALEAEAGGEERAYAAYLAGRATGADLAALPPRHRAVAGGDAGALVAVEDPLARLVAAGVLFRQGRLTPGGVAIAVDTASERGWRRPLLAWLGVQRALALAAGDAAAASALARRIELVTESPAHP